MLASATHRRLEEGQRGPAVAHTGATEHGHAAARMAKAPTASLRRLQRTLLFRWPADGTITTPFIPSGPLRHDGIDIGSLRSLGIVAAFGGRVIHVGRTVGFSGYGNIVDVEVASGVETIYAHLSAWRVDVGETVRGGEAIGTAGCTGRCTGTHLHFEVRVDGVPVDPLLFLPRA